MRSKRHRPSMRCFSFFAAALFLLSAPVLASGASPIDDVAVNLWVSTDGSDLGSGDAVDPVRTIQRARDVVRAHRERGIKTINVYIKGGVYQLDQTLRLGADDSGASGAEVVYQSAPGESVVISGGRQVTGWTQADSLLNIWQAQVDTSRMPRQLYVNGQLIEIETSQMR